MSFSLLRILLNHFSLFFFFNDTATTEIYTLSLHDALPICYVKNALSGLVFEGVLGALLTGLMVFLFLRDIRSAVIVVITDRKSTRLNSSHQIISYAVFCLKKKKITSNKKSSTVSIISDKCE